MTKLREPLSIEFVLSQVLPKLEDEEVKKSTGKSISHFRKCGDADDKDHNIHLADAIKLPIRPPIFIKTLDIFSYSLIFLSSYSSLKFK